MFPPQLYEVNMVQTLHQAVHFVVRHIKNVWSLLLADLLVCEILKSVIKDFGIVTISRKSLFF